MSIKPHYRGLGRPGLNRSDEIWGMLRKLTGVAQPEAQLRGFCLHLGDGSRWWIAGFPPATKWVEELATIMQLTPGEAGDASIIVFLEGKTPPERVKQLVAMDPGWLTLNANHMNRWFRRDSPDILCELNAPLSEVEGYISLWQSLQFIHRQSINRGGLPFHAALVEHEGKGVILAGAGDTGKSTCCSRLPLPWRAWCDDEVLLALAPDGRYLAHPFPTWGDYIMERGGNTWRTQDCSPLAGIFLLEQSSSDACLPLSPFEAAKEVTVSAQQLVWGLLLYGGSEEARSIRAAVFSNACELIKKIPVFRLRVSLTGRFWEHIEVALGWR